MKIDDLRHQWYDKRNFGVQIRHQNNKDVNFWPTSLTETENEIILNGWWIILQTNEPSVQEEIKIKKEDLDGWNIVKD